MDNNKITVSFNHVDHSDNFEKMVREQIEKLIKKHDKHITRIDYTVSKENPKESTNQELFKSSLHVHAKMKKELNFKVINPDPKKTLSDLVNKAVNRLNKEFSK
jgi:ribosome-associated translation inhibitor RaiA